MGLLLTDNMEYVLIEESDFQRARKKIIEKKGSRIIFSGRDDELNRKILEKEKVDVILIRFAGRKDKMKQRDSGFNHVLAKLAKKSGVSVGLDFDEIKRVDAREKARILARARQNIKLCNKNKLKMAFISSEKQDKHDLKSLGLALGMPSLMVSCLEIIQTKPF